MNFFSSFDSRISFLLLVILRTSGSTTFSTSEFLPVAGLHLNILHVHFSESGPSQFGPSRSGPSESCPWSF